MHTVPFRKAEAASPGALSALAERTFRETIAGFNTETDMQSCGATSCNISALFEIPELRHKRLIVAERGSGLAVE